MNQIDKDIEFEKELERRTHEAIENLVAASYGREDSESYMRKAAQRARARYYREQINEQPSLVALAPVEEHRKGPGSNL